MWDEAKIKLIHRNGVRAYCAADIKGSVESRESSMQDVTRVRSMMTMVMVMVIGRQCGISELDTFIQSIFVV